MLLNMLGCMGSGGSFVVGERRYLFTTIKGTVRKTQQQNRSTSNNATLNCETFPPNFLGPISNNLLTSNTIKICNSIWRTTWNQSKDRVLKFYLVLAVFDFLTIYLQLKTSQRRIETIIHLSLSNWNWQRSHGSNYLIHEISGPGHSFFPPKASHGLWATNCLVSGWDWVYSV